MLKSGPITDPDRLFNDLSIHIGDKYMQIGNELGLQYNYLENELHTEALTIKPTNQKAMKMLHLWHKYVVDDNFTYSVLAAALEKHGLRRCADEYCYSTGNCMNSLCMS